MSQKKKLEKLTPEQERLMYEFRDNYINYVLQNNSDEKINFLDTYNKIKNNIWWRYEKAGLKNKKPLILMADSYLEEKLMINYVKMISEIGDQVRDQVWNQVSDQVWNQVRDQVRDQVSNQVKNQVWNQVKNQKLQFIEQYFGLGYEYWISFYEFFNKIGILKGKEKEKFNKYIQPYKDGKIWSAQFFENFVFICRLPKKINRDSSNRLHSINEAAVQWNGLDYFGKRDLYFIHGVFFEKNEWLKIVNNEISAKDLLKMENKEKQRAALSVYSMEKLIQELDAQEIDVYKNPRDGNEIVMYQIDSKKVDLEQDIKYLKYKDPSTDRVYISGIPPETNTAREGIAWKFGLSVEEYENDILNES